MEKLFDWIINYDEISIVCCPSFLFVNTVRKLGIDVDNINYDINFKDMPHGVDHMPVFVGTVDEFLESYAN